MISSKLLATLIGTFALLCPFASLFAQSAPPISPGVGVPSVKSPPPPVSELAKKLDSLEAANNLNGLASTLMSAPLQERMAWLTEAVFRGGSSMLSIALINDLSSLSTGLKQSQPAAANATLALAGVITLYTYQIMLIDGPRCADATAPSARRTTYLSSFRPMFAYVKSLADKSKADVIEKALKLEATTSQRRGEDHYLCSGGLAQTQAALAESGYSDKTVGDLMKASPSAKLNSPGNVGQIPAAKSYVPSFVGKDAYTPKQAEIRASMRTTLQDILK